MEGNNKNKYEKIVGIYKIKIIPSMCIGAASCLAVSPDLYELEDNIAQLKNNGTDTLENILLSAQVCPTRAIEVYNIETGDKLWPRS